MAENTHAESFAPSGTYSGMNKLIPHIEECQEAYTENTGRMAAAIRPSLGIAVHTSATVWVGGLQGVSMRRTQ